MGLPGTRKQRAAELLKTLEEGPHTGDIQVSKEDYDTWAETWIIPEIKDLIPELKKQKKEI